jgi:hypothetical protein
VKQDVADILREHGIQPSAQRLAVAEYVLDTRDHPSADQVLERVSDKIPMLSRATVYNTLTLFVEKGLLRELVLAGEGGVRSQCRAAPSFHRREDRDHPRHPLERRARLQGEAARRVRRSEVLGGDAGPAPPPVRRREVGGPSP